MSKAAIGAPTDAIVKPSQERPLRQRPHPLKVTCRHARLAESGMKALALVDKVGRAVNRVSRRRSSYVSWISSCGKCDDCRRGMHRISRQWWLDPGDTIDGTQARMSLSHSSETRLHHIPQAR